MGLSKQLKIRHMLYFPLASNILFRIIYIKFADIYVCKYVQSNDMEVLYDLDNARATTDTFV